MLQLVNIDQVTVQQLNDALVGQTFDVARSFIEDKFKTVFPDKNLKPIVDETVVDKKSGKTWTEPRMQSLSQMIKAYQLGRKYENDKAQKAEAREIIFRARRADLADFLLVITKSMGYQSVFTGATKKGQINIGLQPDKAVPNAFKEWSKKQNTEEAAKFVTAKAEADPISARVLAELKDAARKAGVKQLVIDVEAEVVTEEVKS